MNRKPFLLAVSITLLLLVGLFLYWLLHWRFIESTTDAYVNGNQVVVTSQIDGYVKQVLCQDTQKVHEGDLLVQLDETDRLIALEEAKKSLAAAARNYVSLQEKVATLRAEKEVRLSEFIRTGLDFVHRQKLVESGAVSLEDFQHAEAAFVAAFASTQYAEHAVKEAEAQISHTTLRTYPEVVEAIQRVRQTYINWKRCKILAPATGMVAQKTVQVGQSIQSNSMLLIVVPFDQMWVDANYKEVQLKGVKAGMPVTLRSDLYGRSLLFHGRVLDINAGTGSVFSVLPPQNATGNWIKIVQRLAVRIALDPYEVETHPLRLGLSMTTTIDLRNPVRPVDDSVVLKTNVFAHQEEGVDALIDQILEENVFWTPSL